MKTRPNNEYQPNKGIAVGKQKSDNIFNAACEGDNINIVVHKSDIDKCIKLFKTNNRQFVKGLEHLSKSQVQIDDLIRIIEKAFNHVCKGCEAKDAIIEFLKRHMRYSCQQHRKRLSSATTFAQTSH